MNSIYCQACGMSAPTKYVEFDKVFCVVFFVRKTPLKGNLCRRCIHKYFWEFTLMTLLMGWWGIFSFFMTIVAIPKNVFGYVKIFGLESSSSRYSSDALSSGSKQKLGRYKEEILSRILAGESPRRVASDIAAMTSVSHDQILLYIYQEIEGD